MMTQQSSRFEQFEQNRLDKREKRKAELAKTVATAGITFESKHKGMHLLIKSVYGLIDFYPETGRWYVRQTQQHARGTQTLINFLTQQK